jgi:hypothetical protein
MTTQEAYEQAVKKLCTAARRKDHESLGWLAHAIVILWERAKQEALAKSMDAFSPHQVITLANSHHPTCAAIKRMRDDAETYGSMFKSNVVAGLGD